MTKHLSRTCCLLLSFVLPASILSAQAPQQPATIITRQSDTLKVWISAIHTRSVRFKRDSPGAASETLTAFDVRSLTASDGSRYIGAAVLVDRTPVNVEVPRTLDSAFLRLQQDTVLLMVEYLSPKMSLYSLADKDKPHFFIEAPGVPLTELYHRVYRDRNNVEREDQEYIRQLQRWMSDCPEVAGGLVDLVYRPQPLKKALRSYTHQCGNKTEISYESIEPRAKLRVTALAGIFNPGVAVSTSPTGGSFNLTGSMQSRYAFTAGLDAEYFVAGAHKKFSVAGTLLFNRATAAESEYTEYASPSAYTLRTLTVDYSSLRIDFLARYRFADGGDVVPYINGGFLFGSVLSVNNTMVTDEYFDNAHHVSSTDPFAGGFKRFQTGFTAGAGVRYKRLQLDYRFAEVLNVVFIMGTSVHLAEQQLCLGFQLNR